jgi:hypothetical protein
LALNALLLHCINFKPALNVFLSFHRFPSFPLLPKRFKETIGKQVSVSDEELIYFGNINIFSNFVAMPTTDTHSKIFRERRRIFQDIRRFISPDTPLVQTLTYHKLNLLNTKLIECLTYQIGQ